MLEKAVKDGQMLLENNRSANEKHKREWKEAMGKLHEFEKIKTQMLEMKLAIERKTDVAQARQQFQQMEQSARRTMEREMFRAEDLSRRLVERDAELERVREHLAQAVAAFKALREEYEEHMDEPPSVKLPKEFRDSDESDDEEED